MKRIIFLGSAIMALAFQADSFAATNFYASGQFCLPQDGSTANWNAAYTYNYSSTQSALIVCPATGINPSTAISPNGALFYYENYNATDCVTTIKYQVTYLNGGYASSSTNYSCATGGNLSYSIFWSPGLLSNVTSAYIIATLPRNNGSGYNGIKNYSLAF